MDHANAVKEDKPKKGKAHESLQAFHPNGMKIDILFYFLAKKGLQTSFRPSSIRRFATSVYRSTFFQSFPYFTYLRILTLLAL